MSRKDGQELIEGSPDTLLVRAILAHLDSHPNIKFVWYDYWCLPQGERTPEEEMVLLLASGGQGQRDEEGEGR